MALTAAALPIASSGARAASDFDRAFADDLSAGARGPGDAIVLTQSRDDAEKPAIPPLSEPPAANETPNGEGMVLYGPPSPKVARGKLAQVDWTEPEEAVPPALEEAIRIVARNYPSAVAARAALRAASSQVKAAKWLRFPTLQANLAYLDSSSSPEPQVVVETPIWSGGRISAGIRRAKASEDASSASYVETIADLAVTTANTYFEIVRLTQTEQLLAESVKIHGQLVGTMERRVKQEVSPLADLELARSRAAQIEQQYNLTRAQRQTALKILAQLVADPTYDLGPIPYYDPEQDLSNRDALVDQAVAYDPTIRRFQAQADIARADLDARKASILPQFNAQYSYDDIFKSRVGVVVRAQTTGGLSQFSEVNAARLRILSSLEQIRDQELQLRREIAADIINYEAAKKRSVISAAASDTAARVSESYMRQFIAGRRNWLDVMNALREAVTAQIGKVESEVTVMSSSARLQLRAGRWRPVFQDMSGDPAQEPGN